MFFQRIYDQTLAQASYLIGCQKTGESIVIDPKRDVDTYLELANQHGLRITHITETHIHADFLAGSRELAAITGATLYLSNEGGPDWQYEFTHVGLRHGDVFGVGNLNLKVLHTPGHTPESLSFLLTDKPATSEPVMLFTGDFVFVGDVGRPDLLEKAAGLVGTQELGARQLYQSLDTFRRLPNFVQVWPGHGAGSACGKALGAVPSSTVGYEKIRNWAFHYEHDPEGFAQVLLADQPEPPRYFAQMKKLNKIERPLLTQVPIHKKLSTPQVREALSRGIPLIDTRSKDLFAQGFVPGSLNIQGTTSFSTWMGWLMDYDKPFMLVADESQMEDLTRKLMRIGLDSLYGFTDSITNLGINLAKSDLIDTETVDAYVGRDEWQLIDLRGAAEYKRGHLPGAQNIFVGTLAQNLDKISKNKRVVVYCQGGDRATIGYSLLIAQGFTHVQNYSGSLNAWINQGHPMVSEELEPVID
ncbi:MBL fold metallo-hydrolase [Spirosoma endophyticum]|uniref:Hydroxyacylglutathione hydrolase n=1 Tax=Spirosoma endophyticum TaxID=662367 RepID=A0A1I2FBV0_9BACT|nr:MBL fold metallo-hydrolase [Spirosoma endophyticum]SFF02862.1 hydroxyacylglutathione hydrolase [Spirosoma endophyticum]